MNQEALNGTLDHKLCTEIFRPRVSASAPASPAETVPDGGWVSNCLRLRSRRSLSPAGAGQRRGAGRLGGCLVF